MGIEAGRVKVAYPMLWNGVDELAAVRPQRVIADPQLQCEPIAATQALFEI
jgi:hypothetical protein